MGAEPEQAGLVPDIASIPSSSPGEALRRSREALGYATEDVAKRLYVPVRVVEALEEDRYADLPEPPYVKGYIGSYARFLGLDPQPLIASYQERVHPEDPAIFSSRVPSGGHSHRFLIVWGTAAVIVISVVLVVNWWLEHRPEEAEVLPTSTEEVTQGRAGPTRTEEGRPASEPVPDLDVMAQDVRPEAVATAPPFEMAPVSDIPKGRSPDETGVASRSEPSPPSGGAAAMSEPEPVEPPPESTGTPAPPAAGMHRLQLSFGAQSWTEIYDGGDNRLLFDLIKAGETRTVEGRSPFRIVLGNARAVRLKLDGRPVEIGPESLRGSTARFSVDAASPR